MNRLLRRGSVGLLVLVALVLAPIQPAVADTTFTPPSGVCTSAAYGCLRVQTVPTLRGVRFQVETYAGRFSARTDANGFAYLTGWTPGETARLSIMTPKVNRNGYVADFQKWSDGIGSHTSRLISFPGGYRETIQVGFYLSFWMTRSFWDDQDPANKIDSTKITSLEIKRSDSAIINPFTDTTDCPDGGNNSETATGRCLLQATRLYPGTFGFQPSPVTYSVQTVTYDGQNIVYTGSNTFTCAWPFDKTNDCRPNGVWSIKTLFYNVSVDVRDRLIGSPAGTSLDLVYPDNHTVPYQLHDGQADLGEIPRGDYTVVVHGAGLSLKAPMNVSQDSDANLVFLSYIDLLIILAAMSLFIGGFLWLGRRRYAREGGSTRPAYLDDVYDELAEEEALREAPVTELRPRTATPDLQAPVDSRLPKPVRAPEPTGDHKSFAERAAALEKEFELRPRTTSAGNPPPESSATSAGPLDDPDTSDRRARPMSPQEQAAFHVPTEVEVAAEDASRASSLPNIVEHRIVELQAVAKANVAASKRPRFRRVVEPELADWTQEDPATVESEPTAGLDDEPAPDQAAGDGANEAASADVAEEPHQEEEVPEAVAASAAAPPESATPKRAPGPGRKARTSRQRRPGSSGKGRPRGSGHRRPRPGTTSKPKDATHDDDVVPTPVDNPEPTRVDDPEPTPVDTVEPLSAAEDSDAPAEVPMGHSPRRPRRVASRAKETVVVPDADDQPIPIHLNGEVAVEPDPPEEADLRPIAGGDGTESPTPAARRRRPRSHLPQSSVAFEE